MAEQPSQPEGIMTPESGEIFVDDVVFTKEKSHKTGRVYYKNSEKGRKAIYVKEGETPKEGVAYSVKVIEDTEPGNPQKGKYVVELMRGLDLSEEEWRNVEKNVNEAEKNLRLADKFSVEIGQLTGVQTVDREGMSDK